MGVGSERGTTNFDVVYADAIFCGGTIVGSSQLPVTNDVSGTFTGSKILSSIVNVKGTVTGSQIVGTFNGIAANDTVGFLALTGTSFYALVGTIVGSQAHGLASAPVAVMIAPMFAFGTFQPPYQRAAADSTNVFVSAGTVGTVQITAIA